MVVRRPSRLSVFTDGAFSANTNAGGWAWAVSSRPPGEGLEGLGGVRGTTSQRMEMTAVLEALTTLCGLPLTICSDSAYVVNCFNDKWYEAWIRRGWQTKANNPVANQDLWEKMIPLVVDHSIQFRKVKGHSGNPMNEYVDWLAVRAKRAVM